MENNLPAFTAGSLTAKIQVASIMGLFEQIILSDAPVGRFKQFAQAVEHNTVKLSPSTKHMINRDYGKFNTVASLEYRCQTSSGSIVAIKPELRVKLIL